MSLNNDEKKLEERVAELEREMSKLQGLVDEIKALRRDMSSKVDKMQDAADEMQYLNKRLFKTNSRVIELLALPRSLRPERVREWEMEDNNRED